MPSQLGLDLVYATRLIATGGAAALVAVLFSWLGAQFPRFDRQPNGIKFIEQVGASAALGLLAFYLVTYQQDLLVTLQPWFAALALAVAPVLANQWWNTRVNPHDSVTVTVQAAPLPETTTTETKTTVSGGE